MLGADCPGVLIVDPVRRALAVVHSGWRGTVAGVVAGGRALRERYGSRADDLLAGIGPGISARRYEVGPEVADAVRTRVPRGDRCVTPGAAIVPTSIWRSRSATSSRRAGLRAASIETMGLCTFDERDVLFSHRRDGATTGRHALVAMWRELARARPVSRLTVPPRATVRRVRSRRRRDPREALVEGLREFVDRVEVLASVLGGLLEEILVDQAEDDLADVVGGLDAPLGEHGAREEAEGLEREIAKAVEQLDARHVLAPLPRREIVKSSDSSRNVYASAA